MNFKMLGVKLKKYLPLVILVIVIISVLVVVFFSNNSSNNTELDNGSLPTNSSSDKIDDNSNLNDNTSNDSEVDNNSSSSSDDSANNFTNNDNTINDSTSNNNSSQNDKPSTSNSSSSLTNNVLKDGTYNCEFMYEGKSLDDDEVIKSWFQRLSAFDSTFLPNETNINEFKSQQTNSNSMFIIKDKGFVKLYLDASTEYVTYDINNKKFILSDKPDSETIFNNALNISLDKDSFTYGNFGFISFYPSIYTDSVKNGMPKGTINFDYDKYSGLGDLVCKASN